MSGLGGRLWEVVAYGKIHYIIDGRRNQSGFWLGGRLREAVAQGGSTV